MPTQVKEENFRANLRHIFLFPFCLFDVVPSKQKNHRKSVSVVVRPINTISLTLLLGNIRHAHYSKKKIGGWVDGWVSHSFVVSLKPLCLRWSTLVRKCTAKRDLRRRKNNNFAVRIFNHVQRCEKKTKCIIFLSLFLSPSYFCPIVRNCQDMTAAAKKEHRKKIFLAF